MLPWHLLDWLPYRKRSLWISPHHILSPDPLLFGYRPYWLLPPRGILLHHRNMFIGSCVKNDFRTVLVEYIFHHGAVGHISNYCFKPNTAVVPFKIFLKEEWWCLGLVDQNQLYCYEPCKLPYYLGAYWTGRSGDKYRFPSIPSNILAEFSMMGSLPSRSSGLTLCICLRLSLPEASYRPMALPAPPDRDVRLSWL